MPVLGELLILSALASALVQWLKNLPVNGNKALSLTILIVVCFGLALAVWALQQFNLWASFLGILATANLIYSFVIQHFEKKNDLSPLGVGFEG